MTALKTIRRVTVYADASLEESLTNAFVEMGSTGYTVINCRGKGAHGVVSDPFSAKDGVAIELLVPPALADAILDYLQDDAFKSRAVSACAVDVQVAADEHF